MLHKVSHKWRSQGSLLGPILFAIVINDFEPLSDRSKFVAYADDLTIIHHVPPLEDNLIQKELEQIESWSRGIGLSLNKTKTKLLTISRSTIDSLPVISLNGSRIERVHKLKILGIFFDSNLKWGNQLDHVTKKCATAMAMIRKANRMGCSKEASRRIYMAYCFSQIAYAWPVYMDLSQVFFKRLLKFETYMKNICDVSLAPLHIRLEHIVYRLAEKIINCFDEHPLNTFFTKRNDTNYNIRRRHILEPITFKTNLSINSFFRIFKYS